MTRAARRAFDYTTVGHVTIDVLEDGSRRPGGSAFYSALQAARLGRRTRVITQGVAAELESLLEPFAGEFDLEIRPAAQSTTLQTLGAGPGRRQRLLAWAGPIEEPVVIDSAVLHLAPVARETSGRFEGRADLVGLTPQGLLRRWPGPDQEIEMVEPSGDELTSVASRCDAIVLSRQERGLCERLIAGTLLGGGVAAVTDEAAPTRILTAGEGELEVAVPPVEGPLDDLGAGDVFAAAFFLGLSDGRQPSEATSFAHAAAAVRISGAGAAAIATTAAVEGRLREVAARPG